MSSARPVVVAIAVAVVLGPTACGKDADKPSAHPTSSTSATAGPTDHSTPTPSPSAGRTVSSPAVGLPEDFPAQDDVPLVAGVVTSKEAGVGGEGHKGWVLQLAATGSQRECFDKAAAVLVRHGFTKRGELTAGDTRQAQFTSDEYAVIISARSDGTTCQLDYEVGKVDH
jgi:hypothetical protein